MKDTKIFAVIFLTSVDKQLFFPNPIVLYGNVNFLMRFRYIYFPLLFYPASALRSRTAVRVFGIFLTPLQSTIRLSYF